MTSKVAIVEFDGNPIPSLRQALDMIGGIADLNIAERSVIIKVGVFNHKEENHTSVSVVDAILNCFNNAPKIYLTESDNYRGTGLERLQIWKDLFTKRIVPFNLSDDPKTKSVQLGDQNMELSHILFKPNVLVDTHIVRSFERGSILKNLFGCIPTSKKMKYHKILPTILADIYETIGGVDLAVLDGTYFWEKVGDRPVQMNALVVGRDAVAVESVGASLVGLDPKNIPVIQEFLKRGLGEGNLKNIKLLGASLDNLRQKFALEIKTQKKVGVRHKGPQTWGGQANQVLQSLIHEKFFKLPNKRKLEDVIKAYEARGLSTQGKESNLTSSLARRVKNGVLKKSKISNQWIYWQE